MVIFRNIYLKIFKFAKAALILNNLALVQIDIFINVPDLTNHWRQPIIDTCLFFI